MSIRWFVKRDEDGEIAYLTRIREEPGGIYPEVWNGTEWVYCQPVISYLVDPLAADEIDAMTATAFISR